MNLFLVHTKLFNCWIHTEEYKWLIPVCYVPVAVGDPKNQDDRWDPSLIFDPCFAENQPCRTPKTQ
jgi:hypothetical protein